MTTVNVNIKDILKGLRPGRIQSVGYMQIIPLILDDPSLQFGDLAIPTDVYVGTRDYGFVQFTNKSDKVQIVPFGSAYMEKRQGQDHAIPHVTLVNKKETKDVMTACCIQSSTGGYLKSEQHKLSILPQSLFEPALNTRDIRGYNRLWEPIEKFNSKLGLRARGHLEDYMDQFEEELDKFVAEFELVHNQIGAIILVDGSVVGIERSPNFAYFKAIWKPLIREAYGSLVLEYRKKFGETPKAPANRKSLNIRKINSLNDLKREYISASKFEDDQTKGVVREFIKDNFTMSKDDSVTHDGEEFEVRTIENKQFRGQAVFIRSRILYTSIFTTKDWQKDGKFHASKSFSI